jgi:HEPN domain-containing protein
LRFLHLADRDIRALNVLVRSDEVDDESIGFHAQQAVEKCLKAALALRRVPFRKTHDLSELLDLMEEHGVPAPPFAESLDELNPYGVLLRYELGDCGPRK